MLIIKLTQSHINSSQKAHCQYV